MQYHVFGETSAITCRLADSRDADALVSLIRMAYRGDASRQGWTSEADYVEGERIGADELLRIIASEQSLMLLLESAGELIGCCQVASLGGGLAYLGTFAVLPARQGRGLGRLLMKIAQQCAATEFSATMMEIMVLAQQKALLDWYERLGFEPTGAMRPFPADTRFARPLRDDLHFVVLSKALSSGPATDEPR